MAEFWDTYLWPGVWMVVRIVLIIAPVMLSVAYLTYFERKVIGAMHLRRGPNVVGPFGCAAHRRRRELFLKETIIPSGANTGVFLLAPALTFFLALVAWAVFPSARHGAGRYQRRYSLSLRHFVAWRLRHTDGRQGVRLLYAFLGAMQSAAQMVSYEVSMGFVIITVLLCVGSLNLSDIVLAQRGPYGMFNWFVFPLLPMAVIFFVSTLAETNRHPFDMPEAEAELVAGYNVEYSAMTFALFFLGEYANMILMSAMTSILFLGGWLPLFDIAPFNWVPGPIWFSEGAFLPVCLRLGAGHLPTLPLRPADASGLESFFAVSLAAVVVVSGFLVFFDLTPIVGSR